MKNKIYRLLQILLRTDVVVSNLVSKIINKLTLIAYQVKTHGDVKIYGRIFIRNKGLITFGHQVLIHSGRYYNPIGGDTICRIITEKGANINIGDNVGISNSTLYARDNITIESHVNIGGGCRIWDNDFHSLNSKNRVLEHVHNIANGIVAKPILIKKHAFIGGSVLILKGVTIGENAIVAAGSVVTKSIPDNEIWGGNPAKKIR